MGNPADISFAHFLYSMFCKGLIQYIIPEVNKSAQYPSSKTILAGGFVFEDTALPHFIMVRRRSWI
jgi:hypothetical protein